MTLEGKYSTDFVDVLTRLLEVEPNRRPDTDELQLLLDNFWNNSVQEQNKSERK